VTPAPAIVYALCALTSVVCSALLFRAHGRNRTRLLLWSSASFAGLAANNILLFVDLIVVPAADLSVLRGVVALLAVSVLLFGLTWDRGA
jgi:hypothetical protein